MAVVEYECGQTCKPQLHWLAELNNHNAVILVLVTPESCCKSIFLNVVYVCKLDWTINGRSLGC